MNRKKLSFILLLLLSLNISAQLIVSEEPIILKTETGVENPVQIAPFCQV
mgnify:CR=1 FL=1